MKNLFFGTGRSIVRKGAEATLVPVAEFVLGKQRILEIYLNVVEWVREFTAWMRRAGHITGWRPRILTGKRGRGWQRFCRLL